MKFFIWPINTAVLTSLRLPDLSSSLTDSLPSLCHSKTDFRVLQNGPKAIWSIPYVSVAFFPSLKENFIAYRSSKVSARSDCIFEIHQLWQSGFSWVYSNCYCSCSFEHKTITIRQSSHKVYRNNIVNFQESTTILNASTMSLEAYWRHILCCANLRVHKWYVCMYVCMYPSMNLSNVVSARARCATRSAF